jgi:hypothetical protein
MCSVSIFCLCSSAAVSIVILVIVARQRRNRICEKGAVIHVEQIAAYVVSALASCSSLFLWKCKEDEHGGARGAADVRQYGQYYGLMICPSCIGALSWAVHMMLYSIIIYHSLEVGVFF